MSTLLETAAFGYQNFYSDALSADLSSVATDVFLSNVPSVSEGTLIIDPFTPAKREIIYYNTLGSGKVTTPANGRGYDNTAATTHTSGTTVIMAPIADWFYSLRQLFTTSPQGWTNLSTVLTYSSNNGQKEFVYNTSNDQSATVAPGMKFNITRPVAAPTQCMAFVFASSQYGTKSTPTNVTPTAAFTIENWVYLNSYQVNATFFAKGGATDGFGMRANATGQLEIYYGTANNFTVFNTQQAIPLKRWVHVAGVVSSVASKTIALYLNGTSVPIVSSLAAATSMSSAGDIYLSKDRTNASGFLDGFLSEVRVWGVAQTQSQIQANMGITLVGSETNLQFLVQGNGTSVDKTSNANNITLNSGANATQLSNPYHNIEYGYITAVSSSQITVFTGTDYVIPNAAVTVQQYSTQKSPFGFPNARWKWRVTSIYRLIYQQNTPATGTWYNFGQVSVPIGEWVGGYNLTFGADRAAGDANASATLSDANSTELDRKYTTNIEGNNVTNAFGTVQVNQDISITTQAIRYLNVKSVSTVSNLYTRGDESNHEVFADLAYV